MKHVNRRGGQGPGAAVDVRPTVQGIKWRMALPDMERRPGDIQGDQHPMQDIVVSG